MNKVYEEFEKIFLNISVAIIIFVFIQPLVMNRFDFIAGLIAISFLFTFMLLAYLFLKKAGDNNG